MHGANDEIDKQLDELLDLNEDDIEVAIKRARDLAENTTDRALQVLLERSAPEEPVPVGANDVIQSRPADAPFPTPPLTSDVNDVERESEKQKATDAQSSPEEVVEQHEHFDYSDSQVAPMPNEAALPQSFSQNADDSLEETLFELASEDQTISDDPDLGDEQDEETILRNDAYSIEPELSVDQSNVEDDFEQTAIRAPVANLKDPETDIPIDDPDSNAPFDQMPIDETEINTNDFDQAESSIQGLELTEDDFIEIDEEEEEAPPPPRPPAMPPIPTSAPEELAVDALDPEGLVAHGVDDLSLPGNAPFGLDSFVDLPDENDDNLAGVDIDIDDDLI